MATSVALQYIDRELVARFGQRMADGVGAKVASLRTNWEVKGNKFAAAKRMAEATERSFDAAHLNDSAGSHLR
jgi:hypothetical protein